MLDHAGDDKRVSLTRGSRGREAAKQMAPSSLFFTLRGGTAQKTRSAEFTRALDALAFDDARGFGAAMRDEWYC